ncbi:cupredoxin domain-containing protein [Candidatus Micrarchaeota archaeon]|nr:cupredoxin domain-containing protein [Candidatus Micrarchaeota archaeon]
MNKLAAAVAVFLPLVLAGCTSYSGGNGGGDGGGGQTVNFTIEAGSLRFAPDSITVKAGDHVHLTIVNKDVFHTFTIDELGVNFQLPAGQTKEFDFTASKSGTFAFYCAVPGHREGGMHGTMRAT